ncbi:hypothetical protein PGTUg99_036402 [Puccinia graminis f. sp. tritici]|uniref:Uncharacterized protein n=1 Tax=Puccinia graminis f. sp. tritici TaxID=56615 RepID=A0A5B0SGM3_PUCGR|nr:hypothetical protein PGTUg99_036402 [Puccinia graminis f. sp. tritici]
MLLEELHVKYINNSEFGQVQPFPTMLTMKERLQLDEISLLHVSTKDTLADMLTKPLNRVPLEKHCPMFGIAP